MLDKEEYAKFHDSFLKGRSSLLNIPGKLLDDQSTHKTMKSYALTPEELKTKTNISKWAKISFAQPIEIKPYPSDYLESILTLEAPKEIISYYNPANAPVVKQPVPKVRAPKTTRTQQTKTNRHSAPGVASLYANEQESSSKRSRTNNDSYERYDDVDEVDMSYIPPKPENLGPPPQLYPAINNIRNHFWDLEYEPQSVSFAFFAMINAKNCQEFGLSDFADDSCSLAVINDRINKTYYLTAEEFEADFRKMFSNIITYYPRTHPAYAKAVELSSVFESMWSSAKQQIK